MMRCSEQVPWLLSLGQRHLTVEGGSRLSQFPYWKLTVELCVRVAEVNATCDVLQVTKIVGKRKNAVTYMFRCSFPLYGVSVQLFETPCE